jgi:type IV pilus assembly protein PilY1
MWKFGCNGATCGSASGESNMGQSWSTPVAFRVKNYAAPLLVFGAGYDPCEDAEDPVTACASVTKGRGIYIMDAATGSAASYRFISPSAGLDATAGRFVADMTTVDVNGDGYIDVIYAVDTRGNLWRINTSDPANGFTGLADVGSWPVTKIATVWDTAASERRKLLYAPGFVVLGTQVTVMFGSGDREKPSATSTSAAVNNRFYGIRDDITKTSGVSVVIGYGAAGAGTDLPDLFNATGKTSANLSTLVGFKGWFINLFTSAPPYEQVVTTPLNIGGVTYFNTFQASSASSCRLGTGRGYQLDFQTGVFKPNDAGLYQPTTFITSGIPPSPVGGVVSLNGKSRAFCVGCPGVSPIGPQQINPNVKKNRKPVYRFQRID